jgi:serine/threonine protein kinase
MQSTVNGYNSAPSLPPILKIGNPKKAPLLQKVKNRLLILSPTVNAGLEKECTIADFDKEREIGKGGFGSVWKVVHKATKKVYCVKIIGKQSIIEQQLVDQMNREIEIMYLLNHPHCLRLKNHFEDDQNFYLLMPLASKGQLYKILRRCKKFDEKTAAQILRETIAALQYMHSFKPPILHRDLKPENLLINDTGRVYLADYGWSNFKNEGDIRKTFCGTPEYIAPEMLKKEGHDHRIDIWCVGVLMFEFLSGYSPFCAKTNQDLYMNIRRLKIQWPNDMPPLAKNLISKILKINPRDRLSLEDILKHKWFQQTPPLHETLKNEFTSEKELLMYHMVNEVTPETETIINSLLGRTDVKVTKSMTFSESGVSTVTLTKKKDDNVLKKMKTQASSSTKSSLSSGNYSIDVNKEQQDKLQMENVKLIKELTTLKNKLNIYENENKNLKVEMSKLNSSNNSQAYEENIRQLKSEIDRWKLKDKDRLALLTEVEEKNNEINELRTKVNLLINEKEQIKKDHDNNLLSIIELKNKIEGNNITIEDMKKKYNLLLQEKDELYYDYQKKIEVMQINLLSNPESNINSEEALTKVIELLNQTMTEIKSIFQKKFDLFTDSFNLFQKEFISRDDKFQAILREKTLLILEQIQRFAGSLPGEIQKVFDKANKPKIEVKDQKIDWLNKQVNELSVYKNRGLEYERTIKELTNSNSVLQQKSKLMEEQVNQTQRTIELTKEAIDKLRLYTYNLESELSDCKQFMIMNLPMDLMEQFNRREQINEQS